MCGIAGIVYKSLDQTVAPNVLKAMTDVLRHRGPDDEGFYIDGNVGLGNRRLSIIDLAGGHLPLSNEDDSIWIAYNGEIYNYVELRNHLIANGHRFKTHSDTEAIVHLYEDEGEQCFAKLNGMYAFALWDTKHKKLLCVRDRFGIKPLYYYVDDNQFIFGSEIKALLQHPTVKARPDWEAIHEYLTFQFCLGDRTFFQGVRKLLPAHYLTWAPAQGKFEVKQYWDLDYTIDETHSEDYFRDKLLFLLEDAVRIQLRSDVPLGAHLSGGLDSSSVVGLAASLLETPIKTFTGSFREGPEYDETPYAKLVAQRVGAEYYEIFPTPHDFTKTIQKIIYFMDEPVAGPGVFPQYFVAKLAREHVKVVLGGQGGDEIFGGYARYLAAYLEQCLKGAIFETQEEGRHVVTLESIIPNLPLLQQYKPMLQQFWTQGLFEPMDRRYFRLVERSHHVQKLYSPEFLEGREETHIWDSFQKLFHRTDTLSYFNKMTHFDIKTLLPALLQVEDRTSMAVSLESRVPLLDHRIAELVAGMPPTVKFRGGESKHIFKQAVRNWVPTEVLARKDKKGFPVPLTEWYQEELREMMQEMLVGREAKNRGLYNIPEVKQMLGNELKFGREIWGLLCLELWFREYIDS
jgi:asparagine synthase (glutamine-hydrolysing)